MFLVSGAVGNDTFLSKVLIVVIGILLIGGVLFGLVVVCRAITKHFMPKDDAFKVIHSTVTDVNFEFYTTRVSNASDRIGDYRSVNNIRYFFKVQGLNEKIYFYNRQMYFNYKDYRGESYFFVYKEKNSYNFIKDYTDNFRGYTI